MKRILLLITVMAFIMVSPAFAGSSNGNGSSNQNGSIHHNYNTTNKGGQSDSNASANAGALGVGVGISNNDIDNTNNINVKNTVKTDVDVTNDLSNRVNTTDINVIKNDQDQNQGQLQGQLQGQSQDASNKQAQGQTTDVNIEDNSVNEGDDYLSWSQGSIGVEKGVNSVGLVHPIFGGIQAGSTEEYAKIMENLNTTIKLAEIGIYNTTEAKERIEKLMSKLDKKTLCNKKFLGIIKLGNPILDLMSFDVCSEL